MLSYGLPIVITLALWWGSTVAILYLDGLDRRTFVWSMAGATLMLGGVAVGLVASRGDATPAGAYQAFACGLLAWAWQLISFYMGFVTGPQKGACPAGCRGWQRFIRAVCTSLYHELAVIAMAGAFLALTWGQPNQLGIWTFVVLWWMHQSAKLNVFFGVPNLSEDLLPGHLQYLASFMTRKPMNLFFPLSVSVSTIITLLLAQKAGAADATDFEVAGFTMLATLMALAVLEHWFLVVPLDTHALWPWSVKSLDPALMPRAALSATGHQAGAGPEIASNGDHATVRHQAAFKACSASG
jgi:putative photosynthetic complex assembly protein 2